MMNLKPRAVGSKPIVRKVLIVCEGQETEPNYFKEFRVAKNVCDVCGTGRNTLSLVQEAVRLAEKKQYLEVWCVFDRDSFSEDDIRAAFVLAHENSFRIAFSNECFELWYILHFNYMDSEISREQYSKILKKILGSYEKNSVDMYRILQDKQKTAIRNAKKLAESHRPDSKPEQCKPYTTVYELVERLNHLALTAN